MFSPLPEPRLGCTFISLVSLFVFFLAFYSSLYSFCCKMCISKFGGLQEGGRAQGPSTNVEMCDCLAEERSKKSPSYR